MNNQISGPSPKPPFFYRNLPIILGVIIVIIVTGIFAWQYFRVVEKEIVPEEEREIEIKCAGEGEFKCTIMGCIPCCSGLVARHYVGDPMRNQNNEVICIGLAMIKCVNCGDGICGKGENWCICPEDCPKPNPEDLEFKYIFQSD